MTAIVPDTLQGAVIVSIIDFFLSFLIISGIGVVLSFFPLLNRAAKWFETRPVPGPAQAAAVAPPPARSALSEQDDDMPAIIAAIYMVMDGAPHHIVHIESTSRAGAWVAGGRIAQHGSHMPR